MKIEQRTKGSYRVRKTIDCKTYTLNYDHKPTQAEVLRDMSEIADSAHIRGSFLSCAKSYIESKENVISPKTVKTYKSLLDCSISDEFKRKKMFQITQQDIQLEVNRIASDHSPKTVRNVHGFISAVLKQFRPNMVIRTTLPQKRPYEHYTPSEDDIRRILDASKDDTQNHICFQLGCMSLRRSEILALTPEDIEGNILTINKAMVQNSDREWVIKETKTSAGTRKIYIPDSLVKEIKKQGYVYNRHPNKMRNALQRYQDKLGIPRFRFHDLRAYFASYAHQNGISEQTIMETGGWHSVECLRKSYRHSMDKEKAQKELFNKMLRKEHKRNRSTKC